MSNFRPGGYQALPPIVKNLIIINVLMVVLQTVLFSSFHINLQNYLGLYYWRSDFFRPWQLVTHMFMHGTPNIAGPGLEETILHVFSNMFALWMFGSVLENIWGPKRFLTFYFICGIGAALCQLAVMSIQLEPIMKGFQNYQLNPTLDHFNQFMNQYFVNNSILKSGAASEYVSNRLIELSNNWSHEPGNLTYLNQSKTVLYDFLYGAKEGSIHLQGYFDDAMVGASGAVFGVLFAFGWLFPNTEMMLIFLPIPIKAKYFIGAYMVFELYAGIRNSATDNVAHFAHLGGALFAFIILKIWNHNVRNRLY